MNCFYLDDRTEFFSLLSLKLHKEFVFTPATVDVVYDPDRLAKCDVLLVGVSRDNGSQFEQQIVKLEKAALNAEGIPVIAFLHEPDRELIHKVIVSGAYDCFVQTGSMEELRIILRRATQFHALVREAESLRKSVKYFPDLGCFFGSDPRMVDVLRFATKVAATDASILITGETGTGKELLARAIHLASPRAQQPFLAVSCSAFPESLIEAELFGYDKGAFTGAAAVRRGRFEVVGRGTLFLDEVGDLSPTLQVKLLRVLQERTFERLGSNQSRTLEARILCATNRELKELTSAGTFRSDLYYRLHTIHIEMPSLRDRRDDVVLLAHHFLQEYAVRHNRPARRFNPQALCALKRHSWPGNVRELQHAIEHATILCDGPEIRLDHLPTEVVQLHSSEDPDSTSFDFEVRTFKRQLIQRKLEQNHQNKVRAARCLKISRSSLHRLIEELGIGSSQAERRIRCIGLANPPVS
jgi:DNA-binding NtrC family response regulator